MLILDIKRKFDFQILPDCNHYLCTFDLESCQTAQARLGRKDDCPPPRDLQRQTHLPTVWEVCVGAAIHLNFWCDDRCGLSGIGVSSNDADGFLPRHWQQEEVQGPQATANCQQDTILYTFSCRATWAVRTMRRVPKSSELLASTLLPESDTQR